MFKKYSKRIKQRIRNLRSRGWSLGEIGLKTGIPKNTLSEWVRDIQLSKAQEKRIKEKEIASAAIGRDIARKILREKIDKWKEKIREKVKHFGKSALLNQEMGKLVCGLLYLCEGSKYTSTRCLIFGNSDPRIIKAFLNLLRNYFRIREDKLRCRITPRWDQNINKLQIFWSNITKIPIEQFYHTIPDKRTKGKTTGKEDYQGVCVIYYCDTSLQFELQSIGEAVIKGVGGKSKS